MERLLFSDVSVLLTFVHADPFLMIVLILNTMLRIDKSLIEAARDGGTTGV